MENVNNLQSITRKTLLYKSGVEYAGYALNHVEGCAHGCKYPCYAMMLKKRCGKIKTYDDWIRPKLVGNALELLDKEIPRLRGKINHVFLCFATDPFMHQIKGVEQLTLRILEKLNRHKIKAVLISKGVYPEVLVDKSIYGDNDYGSTVVSLSEGFRKRFEPYTAPIGSRIEALRRLHEAGLRTWVSLEPYPTPNIISQSIEKVLNQISFVDRIVFGKWNYNRQTSVYRTYKEFYNLQSAKVIRFCKTNNIECHIKDGTINLDNASAIPLSERESLACYA